MGNETLAAGANESARRVAVAALSSVVGVACLLTFGASRLRGPFAFDAGFSYAAGGVFVLAACAIPRKAALFHRHARFGLANTLTVIRLALSCLLAAFALELCRGHAAGEAAAWTFFGCALAALILDGLDGFVARRLHMSSVFGTRLDMEVDAFMILVLSVIAFVLGKAGVWVMVSGFLRYAYVLAAHVVPALNRPLPPAWRRKAIAVIQGATLTALLTPVVQPPLSAAAAALALVLLIYSFGADIMMQIRQP